MLYLDTAVVLTLFSAEQTSRRVETWLAGRRQTLAFSDWGLTEAASALGIRHRRGELDKDGALQTFEAVSAFASRSCDLLVCDAAHQREAQDMLSGFELPLRAGDALHLAISRRAGATLVTYDTQLVAAARALAIKVRDPLPRR